MIARCHPNGRRLTALLHGAALGAAALIGLLTAMPEASAQFGHYVSRDEPWGLIPPRAVADRLENRGFTGLSRPRFDGTAYIIDAINPTGARVRLYVDAQNGAIIGRRPLDVPYYPYYPSAREVRPTTGYGWTEDDVSRRRTARAAEGLVPPADIPAAVGPYPRKQAALGAETSPRMATPDANPLGANPDGKAHPASPPRKVARLAQPPKPAAATTPITASAPKVDSSETAKAGETAASASSNVEPTKPDAGTSDAPPPAQARSQEQDEKAAAEALKADGQKQDQAWRDPTPEESKRKVRVINGATVVPGSGETPSATN